MEQTLQYVIQTYANLTGNVGINGLLSGTGATFTGNFLGNTTTSETAVVYGKLIANSASFSNINTNHMHSSSVNFNDAKIDNIQGSTAQLNKLKSSGLDTLDLTVGNSANLTSGLVIQKNNIIELGNNIPGGKEVNAGKIGYNTFSDNSLDIVGAGQNTPRHVKIYDNLSVVSDIDAGGNIFIRGGDINVGRDTNIGNSINVRGGASEHNPQNLQTHFPWNNDRHNYIRGDTEIHGNTNNLGDFNIGRDLKVNRQLCLRNTCVSEEQLRKLL